MSVWGCLVSRAPRSQRDLQEGLTSSQEVASQNCIASLGWGTWLCGKWLSLWVDSGWCAKLPLNLASPKFYVIAGRSSISHPHHQTLSLRIRYQQPELKMMLIALRLLLLLALYKFLLQTLKASAKNSRLANQSNRWPRKCTVKHCHRPTRPTG